MEPTVLSPELPYPSVDALLGEQLYPNEAALTHQIADEIEATLRRHYRPGEARRDVHAKATGCLRAEFRVHASLPAPLATGVFIPGNVYPALLRFSNGSGEPRPQPDGHADGRGLAIKLFGVPGTKLLETASTATTQDFILINHPVFLTNDPHTHLTLIQKSSGNLLTKLTIPLTLGLEGTRLAQALNAGTITNPLQVRYYSAVPYQLGLGPDRQAVKYVVLPSTEAVDPMPADPGPDFLREAMRATLRRGAVTLRFCVQPRTSDRQSVEDAMHAWPEAEAPWIEVATIEIPRQEFDTPELNQLGEQLSFNPWHTLPAHRPLGALNRIRKIVYERISRVRNTMNAVYQPEP